MSENQDRRRENNLVSLARSLGRSRSGQAFVAVLVAIGSLVLAYLAWRLPDLSSVVLSAGLIFYGLRAAWRILPIPANTRARWTREQQIAKVHPAWHYQGFLGAGISLLIVECWRRGFDGGLDCYGVILPGSLIVIGAVSYVVCHRFARHEQSRDL